MELVPFGKLATDNCKRDAAHIAFIPIEPEEGQLLRRSDRVKINNKYKAIKADGSDYHGLVDPFLDDNITIGPGDKFYLLFIPNSITSLRHVFIHPVLEAIAKERLSAQ